MAGRLQLTEQLNPMAQTFRVLEPGGSVLTGIGLFFEKVPSGTQPQVPITIELRPVTENGDPSSQRFIPGTRVSHLPSEITGANTTFSASTEKKFTFREPVYIPSNSEVAIVAYTAAGAGQYRIYAGTLGDTALGSNTQRVTHQLDAGVFFQSSNGTVWSKDQNTDIAFKVYPSEFKSTVGTVRIKPTLPPVKNLTENSVTQNIISYPAAPLITDSGSTSLNVLHPSHGFQVGDNVTLSGLDSTAQYNGVFGSSILGSRAVTAADPYGYSVTMDSAATATGRTGGTVVKATEQYIINDFTLSVPNLTPPGTSINTGGNFVTSKSFGGTETAGSRTLKVPVEVNSISALKDPHVVLSSENEFGTLGVQDRASTYFDIDLITDNKFVAPYINANAAALLTISNFIDLQDSAGTVSTITYAAETNPNGGTIPSKHITVPYALENDATSIRIMLDAVRPQGAEFTVWYRTGRSTSDILLSDTSWTAFSTSVNPPNKSNYSQIEQSRKNEQYEFNVFDIPSFNEYQIKITFTTTRSSNVPVIRNLRTIATV